MITLSAQHLGLFLERDGRQGTIGSKFGSVGSLRGQQVCRFTSRSPLAQKALSGRPDWRAYAALCTIHTSKNIAWWFFG